MTAKLSSVTSPFPSVQCTEPFQACITERDFSGFQCRESFQTHCAVTYRLSSVKSCALSHASLLLGKDCISGICSVVQEQDLHGDVQTHVCISYMGSTSH